MSLHLVHPRTVCVESIHTEIVMVNGMRKVNYTCHCHPHCYLSGVEEELIGDEKLKSCAAINSATGKIDLL